VVEQGHEVQICDHDEPLKRTGAVVGAQAPADPDHLPIKPPRQWNHFDISVVGQAITVRLNDKVITEYTAHKNISGCVGIQSMTDSTGKVYHVHFRDIRVVELKRDEKAIPIEGL